MITCPPPLEQAKALTHKSPTARSMSSSERFGSADWSSEFTDSLILMMGEAASLTYHPVGKTVRLS